MPFDILAILVKASPMLARRVPSVTRAASDPHVHRHLSNLTKDAASGPWARRIGARVDEVVALAQPLMHRPDQEPQAREWLRRADLLRDSLQHLPTERIDLRRHLERVADQTAQLRWEIDHYQKQAPRG